MKRLRITLVGVLAILVTPVGWILKIVGLASLPQDLKTWGIVLAALLEDPLVYGPAILGVALIAFANFPALRFWEQHKNAGEQRFIRNMTAWTALDNILDESMIGKTFTGTMRAVNACMAFCQAAEDGKISVEGRKQHHPDTGEIPHTYWRTAQIDLIKYLSYRARKYETSDGGATAMGRSIVSQSLFVTYVGLRVNENEVKALWPAANT